MTEDADADINAYMNDPKAKVMWGKFFPEWKHIDPLSDTPVRWNGTMVPAKQVLRDFAVRSVRTGIQVSERTSEGMN